MISNLKNLIQSLTSLVTIATNEPDAETSSRNTRKQICDHSYKRKYIQATEILIPEIKKVNHQK